MQLLAKACSSLICSCHGLDEGQDKANQDAACVAYPLHADPVAALLMVLDGAGVYVVDPAAVRFRVEPGQQVSIDDQVRGPVSWDAEATVGDFILLRSNGMPVYNFCVAIDDMEMGITDVIRAEEHLTNTLRQGLILEARGRRSEGRRVGNGCRARWWPAATRRVTMRTGSGAACVMTTTTAAR